MGDRRTFLVLPHDSLWAIHGWCLEQRADLSLPSQVRHIVCTSPSADRSSPVKPPLSSPSSTASPARLFLPSPSPPSRRRRRGCHAAPSSAALRRRDRRSPGSRPKAPEWRIAAGCQPSICIELNGAAERRRRARTCPSMGTASWVSSRPERPEIGVSVEWCDASHWAIPATQSYRCVEHLSERPYVQSYTYRLGLQPSRASIV